MQPEDLEKTNALFNLISLELDTDKIYLYANNPYKAKYSNDKWSNLAQPETDNKKYSKKKL